METITTLLFGILILLLPSNLGKHFVLSSSYVSGTLVDYLVPTIYFSDIATVLFIASLFLFRQNIKLSFRRLSRDPAKIALLIFTLFLTLSLLLNFSPTSFYKYSRLLFYIILALTVSTMTFTLRRLLTLGRFLTVSVFIQSLLGLYQFVTQHSLCGYLCFGETSLSALSYGITKDFFGSQFLILPYGTFPHPNILGGFLALSLPLLLYFYFVTTQRRFLLISFLAFLVLLLTKSQAAVLVGSLGVISLLIYSCHSREGGNPVIPLNIISGSQIAASGMTGTGWLPVPVSWLSNVSFWRRLQLADVSLKMIADKPWFGVGLNNFIPSLAVYGYSAGWPGFFQPVHNIYLLIASESGLPALFALLLSVLCLLLSLLRTHRYLLALTLTQLLLLGLWDHYLWTTPQGLLMLWLTLGISLSKLKKPNAPI